MAPTKASISPDEEADEGHDGQGLGPAFLDEQDEVRAPIARPAEQEGPESLTRLSNEGDQVDDLPACIEGLVADPGEPSDTL